MDLFTFQGDDFHIFRNGVTQTVNEALWEAAAHINKLQHNLLQELDFQSFFRMNCCILGMTLDMVWSFLLVELHENGPLDLVYPGGMDRAYDNTPGVGLIHQISASCAGIW